MHPNYREFVINHLSPRLILLDENLVADEEVLTGATYRPTPAPPPNTAGL